ncbi:MAG: zinc ribbon domain-containing protein [SAR324 cluster bacterium]|nr:zinc ribbon domain-containing protein [SAR324 cluster bacterium]
MLWYIFPTQLCLSALWWSLLVFWAFRPSAETLQTSVWVGLCASLISIYVVELVMDSLWLHGFPMKTGPKYPIQTLIQSLFSGASQMTGLLAGLWLTLRASKISRSDPRDLLLYAASTGIGYNLINGISPDANIFQSQRLTPIFMCLTSLLGYILTSRQFRSDPAEKGTLGLLWVATVLLRGLLYFLRNMEFVLYGFLIIGLDLVVLTGWFVWVVPFVKSQSLNLKPGECHRCGTRNAPDAPSCQQCRTPLTARFYRICRDCVIRIPYNARFCPKCGTLMKKPAR